MGIPAGFDVPFVGDCLRVGVPFVDAANDIAAFPLESTTLVPDYMRFFRIEKTLAPIPDSTSIVVLGFPVDNSVLYSRITPLRVWKALGLTTEHGLYLDSLQDRYALHSSFDVMRHFVMEYSRAQDGITPPGFSGAGAWCVANSAGLVWHAEPVLAGVFTCWHRKTGSHPHLIQATRGEILKRLFEGSLLAASG
jgi:hypothetical protein